MKTEDDPNSEEEEELEYESDSSVDDTLGFKPDEFGKGKRRTKKHTKGGDGDDEGEKDANPLLLDLDASSRDARRKKKSAMFFDRMEDKAEEGDEELLEADVANAVQSIKSKGGKVLGS